MPTHQKQTMWGRAPSPVPVELSSTAFAGNPGPELAEALSQAEGTMKAVDILKALNWMWQCGGAHPPETNSRLANRTANKPPRITSNTKQKPGHQCGTPGFSNSKP